MFFFRLLIRSLRAYTQYTLINLGGLTLGITSALLIGLMILHESTFDLFNPNIDKLYQVYTVYRDAGKSEKTAHTALPFGSRLKDKLGQDYPITSLWQYTYPGVKFSAGDKELSSFTGYSADSNFYSLFPFPLLSGDPDHFLKEPNTAAITRSVALALFGTSEAVGESFFVDTLGFKVIAVFEDLPGNSLIQFDVLFSENVRYLFYPNFNYRWWEGGLQIFALLENPHEKKQIENALEEIRKNDLSPEFRDWFSYGIQAFRGSHLDPTLTGQIVEPVSEKYLQILFLIALAVLLISWFNYTILSLSMAEARSKETALFKVNGAKRIHLVVLRMAEGVLLSSIAVYCSAVFVRWLLPWFNGITEKHISLAIFDEKVWLALVFFAILTGLIISLYPAFSLSRFSVVESVQKQMRWSRRTFSVRTLLLTGQLFIALTLLMGEGVIIRQLQHMMHHQLGFEAKNLYSIHLGFLHRSGEERLIMARRYIHELEQKGQSYSLSNPSITENIPGFYFQNQFKVNDGSGKGNNYEMVITSIDENFPEVFGIEIQQGKGFKPGENTSWQYAILNETAMRKLGWTDINEKFIQFHYDPTPITVIGVFNDIHITSLQHAIEPVVYRYASNNYPGFITYRIHPEKATESISLLRSQWEKLFPQTPFEGFFVEDKYRERYGNEKQLISIIGYFSLLSVMLALTGAVAMLSFVAVRRTREAGIRKVHGAKANDIVHLFAIQMGRWILAGFLISGPVTWMIMKEWMNQFPYRADFPFWIFPMVLLFFSVVLWFSVYFIIRRVAGQNPAETLKYE